MAIVSRMSRPKALTRSHSSTGRTVGVDGAAGGGIGLARQAIALLFGAGVEQGGGFLEALVLNQLLDQFQPRIVLARRLLLRCAAAAACF